MISQLLNPAIIDVTLGVQRVVGLGIAAIDAVLTVDELTHRICQCAVANGLGIELEGAVVAWCAVEVDLGLHDEEK